MFTGTEKGTNSIPITVYRSAVGADGNDRLTFLENPVNAFGTDHAENGKAADKDQSEAHGEHQTLFTRSNFLA